MEKRRSEFGTKYLMHYQIGLLMTDRGRREKEDGEVMSEKNGKRGQNDNDGTSRSSRREERRGHKRPRKETQSNGHRKRQRVDGHRDGHRMSGCSVESEREWIDATIESTNEYERVTRYVFTHKI